MHIPFVDLKAQYNSIKADIDNAISSVIENTAFIGGKFVNEFEASFAQSYGISHCIGTGNGTDALVKLNTMLVPAQDIYTYVAILTSVTMIPMAGLGAVCIWQSNLIRTPLQRLLGRKRWNEKTP